LLRQRRTFWEGEVKLANADDIAAAKPLSMPGAQIAAEAIKEALQNALEGDTAAKR